MTPTVSPRQRRGASLAIGGMFLVASALLASAPTAFAEPSTDAVNAIDARYSTFGGQGSLLGTPVAEAVDVQGGAKRDYQGGTIFYSKDSGAHVMYGAILDRYQTLGGPDGSGLGFPKNDESDAGDGVGRFNDFSVPEGASIYWNPQQGASVLKGKVLEAWRQSGGITGPFGYPSADMSVVDGVQTGKFAGPEGTEIQWSKAAGLVTIPAVLAGKIPGFGTPTTEGTTTSMSKPNVAAPEVEKKSNKWLWWIPVILVGLGLLGALGRRLFRRPVEVVAPVKVAARAPEVKKVVPPPPPRPAPVAKPVTPPAPPRPPAPKPPAPPVRPVVKAPPPAPRPVTPPPAPRPVVETPKATLRSEVVEHEVTPVIRYETHTPAETTIQVTYENNAVDGQASRADKSDLTPDHLQE